MKNKKYLDYDNFEEYDEESKKNLKNHNRDSDGKKPQWRADRKKAKKFKLEMQGGEE